MFNVKDLAPDRPVLIAGPTASGKSALALRLAKQQGGVVVNADALQVFAGWSILTAQPNAEERAAAPHALYGHLPFDADYSVGAWLRDLRPLLNGKARPIIVGGTGLYFTALTQGLAEIPATPPEIRAQGDALPLAALLRALDPETTARIDTANRARVQRAWEVLTATGRPLAAWQDATPAPLLPLSAAQPVVIDAPKEWLSPRIAQRFDQMLARGALDEARAMAPHWSPAHLSSKAIGARELIAVLAQDMTLDQARDSAVIATRQYAKRQRSWLRARMRGWTTIAAHKI